MNRLLENAIMATQHTDTMTLDNHSEPKRRCFVAYPSSPADRAESIEKAIEEIDGGAVVDISGWKSLVVGGRIIITAICDQIKASQLFIADVTGLNPNVLFELGYAIAHKKRIWLLLNTNIERATADFNRFQLLTTIGYAPYSNSHDIVTQFYKGAPYSNINQNLYDELLLAAGPVSISDALLYLRCDVETDASMHVARTHLFRSHSVGHRRPARSPASTFFLVCSAGNCRFWCRMSFPFHRIS
jgi:hypothetical protein